MPDAGGRLQRWFAELRRRRVFRVAGVYLVAAWLVIQVADAVFEPLGLPAWALRLVIILAALGFPLACVLAWAFDVTPQGIERTLPGGPPPRRCPPPPRRHPTARPSPSCPSRT